MNNTLHTVELKPEANWSDVMRQFAATPGAKLLRAVHRRGQRQSKMNPARWAVQFIGDKPNLNGLSWTPPLNVDLYYEAA